MSLYSIEFSSQLENRHDSDNDFENDHLPQPVSPKPMTPRRVKRRSVMTRGSSGRHSTNSSRRHSTVRSSTRCSRRLTQNPVTRLLEQQQQKTHSYDSPASPSLIDSLPNYYNNSLSNNNFMAHQNWQHNGHSNPTYQQSSTQSLNETEDLEDLYNNRPASVRSSYSNFHGTRAINYTTTPKHYHHSHATPQVPQKRNNNTNRSSMRSMAFLNNGPPAYSSQGQQQPSVDSETTI